MVQWTEQSKNYWADLRTNHTSMKQIHIVTITVREASASWQCGPGPLLTKQAVHRNCVAVLIARITVIVSS